MAYHAVWEFSGDVDELAGAGVRTVGVVGLKGSDIVTGVVGVLGAGCLMALTEGGVPKERLSRFRGDDDFKAPPELLAGDPEEPLPSDRSSTSTTSRV